MDNFMRHLHFQGYNIRMRRTITAQDKILLDKHFSNLTSTAADPEIFRSGFFVAGKTQINGGTVVIDGNYGCPEYIEDDFLDEQSRPYRIKLPESRLGFEDGERVIIVINDGKTLLMKVHAELAGLIPDHTPNELSSDLIHIGHQNQLEYTDLSVPDAQERIKRFKKTYRNSYGHPKGLYILGASFFGFCGWIIVIFAAYGYIFQYTPAGDDYFKFGLPLIPILTVATVLVYSRLYGRNNNIAREGAKSVTKVILVSTFPALMHPEIRSFTVCEETDYGAVITNNYTSINGFDVRDAAHMLPGQVIYKYETKTGKAFFGTK